MAKLIQTLIPLLSAIALLLALANTVQSQTVTTFFDYVFNGPQPTTLTYQGIAHVPTGPTYLRLTTSDYYAVGRALHSAPVTFNRQGRTTADFETTIRFVITGRNNPGDGLAFFIAPVGSTIPDGSAGGGLGIFGASGTTPNLFAVEFDTYANEGWDPSYPHIGIDLGSRRSTGFVEVGTTTFLMKEVIARISYVSATNLISVHVTTGAETFETSLVYDLTNLLTDEVQVGLSAATGANVAFHDVMSWNFTSTISGINPTNNAHIQQVV